MISFTVSDADKGAIERIAERALAIYRKHGNRRRRLDVLMDLTAAHANGCPLRLADLEAADDFNLMHDVGGIERHLDRDTGRLTGCFRPRFALALCALLFAAACSAPQQREWVYTGPPPPRQMAVLRAEQREIERIAALTDEQVRIELATGRRQTPAGAPRP